MLLLQIESIADTLNSSEWVFPIAECFHIAAFAWSIGLIAAVDYKLLGFGIQHSKPSEVLHDTPPGHCWGWPWCCCRAHFYSSPTRACICTIRRSYLRCMRWPRPFFSITRFIVRWPSLTAHRKLFEQWSPSFLWPCGSAWFSA